jgi:diguanylate cyclase (GGDEF)-like protein/putative nucleotidyltransferase with HDIG domain
LIVGGCVLLTQLSPWQSQDPLRYICYLLMAVVSYRLTVSVPGIAGAMSLFFAYVLFGVVEFSLPETLFLGCLATLLHSISQQPGRIRVSFLAFNVCNMATAIAFTYTLYHSRIVGLAHLEAPVLLALSGAVFFTMNTFSVAAIISLTEEESLLKIWRQGYFWAFPCYLLAAALAGGVSFLNHKVGWQTGLLIIPVIYLMYHSYSLYITGAQKHAEEMAALHLRTIEALALAIEAKDHTTHDHLRRVQVYAIEVGKEMGLNESELEALRAASLLHDIGKLAIPEHIISKPGKLTPEEFEKMKIHPVVGAEILERVRFPYPVTPIVRSHHEKWNGAGYPDGLRGEEIPVGARILAAVDCLDALASDRQYRRAIGLDDAMRKISSESGISFDPKVVQILQRRCQELETMALETPAESARLSLAVKVERGLEPAAGFEKTKPAENGAPKTDFLASIAAARQEVQTLFELAQDLGSSLSLNDTLTLVATRLKRMVPYDSFIIYVPRAEVLKPEYVTGENFRMLSTFEIPFGQGLSGWVAENKKPIVNGNPSVEPGYPADDSRLTPPMKSALSIPLQGLNGLVSVLTIYHGERDFFTQDHLRILLAIGPRVALAIENALRYQQAESSAATDYMTGLPNARSLFLHLDAELARCRRQSTPVVLLVGDLNGFKQVNDRFGHLEGNRLLREVANNLKESCREYDYVARMGGDEFVLVLPGLSLDQIPAKIARLNTIAKDAGRSICNVEFLGLSIGSSSYPDDGADAEQLLAEADRRMYIAKQKEKMKLVEPRGFDFDELLAR